jgi:hypothetical protein
LHGNAPWECGSDLIRCVTRAYEPADEGSDRVGVAAHADRLNQSVADGGGLEYAGKHGGNGLVRLK